jgi:hypothetical protein
VIGNGKQEFPRVAVALATHSMVHAAFTYALANMSAYTVSKLPPAPAEFGLTMVKGTYVHSARQELLDRLLKRDISHVLWIDTDMRFPRDSVMRLLAHKKDVVGINYCQRGLPYEFVAIKRVGWEEGDKGEKLQTLESSTGLEEAAAIGFGMVLMRADVLRRVLPSLDEEPWFWFEWMKGRRQVGEDVYFCNLLKRKGVQIFVDHDLSKVCQHIGEYEYECSHAEALLTVEGPRPLEVLP